MTGGGKPSPGMQIPASAGGDGLLAFYGENTLIRPHIGKKQMLPAAEMRGGYMFMKPYTEGRSILLSLVFFLAFCLFLGACGQVKNAETYEACEPVFSAESGAYPEESISVTLSAPERYKIYYTTDCSIPSEASRLYTGVIPVKSPSPGPNDLSAPDNADLQFYGKHHILQDESLPSAMILRAVAVAPDGTRGKVVTKTYFTGMSLVEHYGDIPVLSIVTAAENLLDPASGIMVRGDFWDRWLTTPEAKSIQEAGRIWEAEANFTQRGIDWERPAELSFFDGSDRPAFQESAGLRIRGSATRLYSQKSFNIFFRSEYGSESLHYALLPEAVDLNGQSISDYRSFALRNGGNGFGRFAGRDAFLQELLADRAFSSQTQRPAIVFLNGEYWGVYTICEKYGKAYITEHYPGIRDDNVVIIKEEELDEGVEADLLLYRELKAFAGYDLSDPAVWDSFSRLMDLESMADYFAAQIYIGNWDWRENKNIRLWRTRVPENTNAFDDGRWRYLLYDTEYSAALYRFSETDVSYNSFQAALENHKLFAAAMQNAQFQELFLKTVQDLGHTELSPERTRMLLETYNDRWQPLMADHYKRFGDSSQVWAMDVEDIQNYFDARYEIITGYIENGITRIRADQEAENVALHSS